MKKYILLLAFAINAGSAAKGFSKQLEFKLRQLKREVTKINSLLVQEIDSAYQELLDNVQDIKTDIIKDRLNMTKKEYTNILLTFFATVADIKTRQSNAYKAIIQAKQKKIDQLQRTIQLLKLRVMSQKRRFSF